MWKTVKKTHTHTHNVQWLVNWIRHGFVGCRLAWKINRFPKAIVIWNGNLMLKCQPFHYNLISIKRKRQWHTKYQLYIVFECTSFIEMPTDFPILVVALRNANVHTCTTHTVQGDANKVRAYLKYAPLQTRKLNNKFMRLSDLFDRYLLFLIFFVGEFPWKYYYFHLKWCSKHEKLCSLIDADMASLPPFK